MQFASVRLVSNDLENLICFYTMLTGVDATRLHPDFAEVRLDGATLALSTERPVRQFNAGAAIAASNRSAIIELQVDDVDAVHARLRSAQVDCVMTPTDLPWGNRSMLLRDPDGNLVNVFSRGTRGA